MDWNLSCSWWNKKLWFPKTVCCVLSCVDFSELAKMSMSLRISVFFKLLGFGLGTGFCLRIGLKVNISENRDFSLCLCLRVL